MLLSRILWLWLSCPDGLDSRSSHGQAAATYIPDPDAREAGKDPILPHVQPDLKPVGAPSLSGR